VVDAERHEAVGELRLEGAGPVPPRPMGARVTPDGRTLYVTGGRAGSVSAFDVASGRLVRTIAGVGARPWGIDLSPDGRTLYVACGPDGDLAVVDAARGRVRARVKVGGSPWGVVASR
jgi:YVTN family beta-propeller protein